MLPVTPVLIPEPFAEDGSKNVIPAQSPGTTEPNASWNLGFPPITMLNRQAGGKPPLGADFNGVLHALSQHIFFAQSGCVFPWMGADDDFPGLNYLVGAHVLGADMKEYIAVQPSGPDVPASGGGYVGPKDPTTDTDHIYWQPVVTVDDLPGPPYELCEFYYFRHPDLRPDFQPAQGGVLQNAKDLYPKAWAYLQTTEGQKLCKTEGEWQAMSTATWATLADGTKVGWDGIGGVPYYVQDLNAGTLRLPDVRGMYAEAAGFDSLGVGGIHGDGGRNVTARFGGTDFQEGVLGAVDVEKSELGGGVTAAAQNALQLALDLSRVVPTAAKNQPRAWGALACCYLGQRAS